VLLHPSVIERFVTVGLKHAQAGRQRDIRTNLRYVARRAAPRLQAPDPIPLARSQAKAPYRQTEIDGYFLCARYQSTERRRQRLRGLLCLGLGAGLDGGDLRYVTGRHVRCRSGGVVVVVDGPRARVVPVLARYHEPLLDAASFAGAGFVTGGTSVNRKNVTANVVARLAGGLDLPRLDIRRLRATWLCEQLDRLGVPALLAAAGVSCTQRLGDIAAHLERPEETAVVELLGGRR
jgi:integrase